MRQFSGSTLKLYDHWAGAELNLINSLNFICINKQLTRAWQFYLYQIVYFICRSINTFIHFKFVRALPFYEVVKRNSFWINEELRFFGSSIHIFYYIAVYMYLMWFILTICSCNTLIIHINVTFEAKLVSVWGRAKILMLIVEQVGMCGMLRYESILLFSLNISATHNFHESSRSNSKH